MHTHDEINNEVARYLAQGKEVHALPDGPERLSISKSDRVFFKDLDAKDNLLDIITSD